LESFIFPSHTQKDTGENTQNYNFTCLINECETWSFTPREEYRLRMLKNGVLKRPTREEVTGGWIK